MAYDIKWFENNMRAVVVPGFGCCSACALRNLDQNIFCKKLQCYDGWTGDFVCWESKVPGLNYDFLTGQPTQQMVEWFNKTPIEQSRKISGDMIKQAIQNAKQK